MRTRKNSKTVIKVVVVAGICLSIIGGNLKSGDKKDQDHVPPKSSSLGKQYITIDSDHPSEAVSPKTVPKKDLAWGAIGNSTAYRVIINGGKEAGGITYDVPAYRDWDRLKWKAPDLPDQILEVKFQNLKKGRAQVWCEVTLAKK